MNLYQKASNGNHEIATSSNFQKFGYGNIVPHWCYRKITSCGKPDFVAITVLSELLYLHRLNEGQEFSSGYAYFERKFNLTRFQLQASTLRLHEAGIVTRSFRAIVVQGRKFPNELHLKLNIDVLRSLIPSNTNTNTNSGDGNVSGRDESSDHLALNDEGAIFCD